jgi:hypothetical protein
MRMLPRGQLQVEAPRKKHGPRPSLSTLRLVLVVRTFGVFSAATRSGVLWLFLKSDQFSVCGADLFSDASETRARVPRTREAHPHERGSTMEHGRGSGAGAPGCRTIDGGVRSSALVAPAPPASRDARPAIAAHPAPLVENQDGFRHAVELLPTPPSSIGPPPDPLAPAPMATPSFSSSLLWYIRYLFFPFCPGTACTCCVLLHL